MSQQKIIIFDASTLISFSINGLFDEIRGLKNIFDGKFIITEEVKKESIDTPMKVRRFQLEALRLKQLLDEKVLEMPESLGIKSSEISKKTQEILDISNSSFIEDGRTIHIIDLGEASCMALGLLANEKKIKNVLAVDERTTRLLIEKPENLEQVFEKRIHVDIKANFDNLKQFKNLNVIRSTELAYIAYKKKITKIKGEGVLESLLYSLRLNGASITDEEIVEMKRL